MRGTDATTVSEFEFCINVIIVYSQIHSKHLFKCPEGSLIIKWVLHCTQAVTRRYLGHTLPSFVSTPLASGLSGPDSLLQQRQTGLDPQTAATPAKPTIKTFIRD